MAASSLTAAAALGSKVAFANKVRFMNNASSFRLWLFFRLLLSFYVCARAANGREREIIFSVKFYHLSLEKLSSQTQTRGKGATKRILLPRRVRVSRRVRRSFRARMKDLISISRLVLGSSILRPFEEKKSAMNG